MSRGLFEELPCCNDIYLETSPGSPHMACSHMTLSYLMSLLPEQLVIFFLFVCSLFLYFQKIHFMTYPRSLSKRSMCVYT